jgi:tetratricopeptide (TPR) repeat protein
MADRALALAEPLELMPVIAEALINRALALTYAGRLQEPLAILRGVLPLAEAHGLGDSQLRALNNLSAGLYNEDFRSAHEIERTAAELARRLGNRGWLLNFLIGNAQSAIFIGDWDRTDQILAEVEEADPPDSLLVQKDSTRAFVQALRGDIATADALLAAIAPVRATADDPRAPWWKRLDEAIVHAFGGRLEEAYAAALDAAAHGVGDPVQPSAEWATRVALWLGDAKRARAALQLHEALPDRGRMVSLMRLSLRAGVHALEGDRDAALAAYREALRSWHDLDIPFFLGLTSLEFATLVGPAQPEAAAAADEARAIWTRLGSPPLLARLDEGLARWAGAATEAQARPAAAVPAER